LRVPLADPGVLLLRSPLKLLLPIVVVAAGVFGFLQVRKHSTKEEEKQ
jgi:hypothetical protein